MARANDRTTVRKLEKLDIEVTVSNSQILNVAAASARRAAAPPPPAGRPHVTLRDLLTLKFFAEGEDQEASGVYNETEHVPIRSLDQVPRRSWPAALVLFVFAAGSFAGGWWLGTTGMSMWWTSSRVPSDSYSRIAGSSPGSAWTKMT